MYPTIKYRIVSLPSAQLISYAMMTSVHFPWCKNENQSSQLHIRALISCIRAGFDHISSVIDHPPRATPDLSRAASELCNPLSRKRSPRPIMEIPYQERNTLEYECDMASKSQMEGSGTCANSFTRMDFARQYLSRIAVNVWAQQDLPRRADSVIQNSPSIPNSCSYRRS
jgi:hypothetical protein